MARKAKGSGFKMKSGNTTTFKQMGSSPILQGADAALVAAAKHAAMANVPKDFSEQYDKTAEGVIAAQKGKTEMLTTAAKELPGIAIAAGRKIGKAVGKWKAGKEGVKKLKSDLAVFGEEGDWKKYKKGAKTKAKADFEKDYQERTEDRKSIADIREITGATVSTKKDKKDKKDKKGKKQHLSKEERKFLKELRASQEKGGEVVTEEAEIGTGTETK
jgi:hypothetical protein